MPIPQRPAPRYLVAKWDDIHHALDAREVNSLISMLTKISRNRRSRNLADTRQYVVVSDKNQEMYDEVWGMVLAEIEKEQAAQRAEALERIQSFRDHIASQLQTRFEFTTDSDTDGDTEAEDVGYALESTTPPVHTPTIEPSLSEVEASFANAWGQAMSTTSGRTVRYAQWQPAVAVSFDDRETPNTAAFDLETLYQ